MLGERAAAIKELTRIYEAHRANMAAQSDQEFRDDLGDAKHW
jgi:hypothetical protein